jgi:hypothetical protein
MAMVSCDVGMLYNSTLLHNPREHSNVEHANSHGIFYDVRLFLAAVPFIPLYKVLACYTPPITRHSGPVPSIVKQTFCHFLMNTVICAKHFCSYLNTGLSPLFCENFRYIGGVNSMLFRNVHWYLGDSILGWSNLTWHVLRLTQCVCEQHICSGRTNRMKFHHNSHYLFSFFSNYDQPQVAVIIL